MRFLAAYQNPKDVSVNATEFEASCKFIVISIEEYQKLLGPGLKKFLDEVEIMAKQQLVLFELQRIRQKLEDETKELANVDDPTKREAKAEVSVNQAIEKYREIMKSCPEQESLE